MTSRVSPSGKDIVTGEIEACVQEQISTSFKLMGGFVAHTVYVSSDLH